VIATVIIHRFLAARANATRLVHGSACATMCVQFRDGSLRMGSTASITSGVDGHGSVLGSRRHERSPASGVTQQILFEDVIVLIFAIDLKTAWDHRRAENANVRAYR
jgi:hypothetical protein